MLIGELREKRTRHLHPHALETRTVGEIEDPLPMLKIVLPISDVSAVHAGKEGTSKVNNKQRLEAHSFR